MVLKRDMSKFIFSIFIAENKSVHIAKYSFKNTVRPRNLPIIFRVSFKKNNKLVSRVGLETLFFDIAYW